MRKPLLLLLGALLAAFAVAAPLPYDESADAKAAVQQALAAAKESRIPVFVLFGANWCEDCRAPDRAIQSAAALAPGRADDAENGDSAVPCGGGRCELGSAH